MFLLAWAEIARGKLASHLATFDRSLLRPLQFGPYGKSIGGMYKPLSAPPTRGTNDHHPISRIYYINADTINRIQSLANRANSIKGNRQKNGRTRIAMNHGEQEQLFVKHRQVHPVCNYFGYVISIPFGDLSISNIMKKPLSSVADEVQEFLSSALKKEHFTGLINWVEPTLARIYCTSNEEEVAFVVSSGLIFPMRRVDFGWVGSYHFSWESSAGYVMPMRSPSRNGDWMVYMHCAKDHLEYLEEKVGYVFKPMSSHYLNLDI
ncbi:hypothetical protein Sjap_003261 [Stephania japonica]|uniref:Uncharacterized protein n=1 Tax=Stephania japonica TaxID=461633 RepID=A0AAP0KNE3_9MAGN